jgi:ribonuclease BN (tRNA processing enzyme)
VLTLTFLGVGSAFAKRNFPSNALVEAWSAGPDRQSAPDATLLIDFGCAGPLALHQLKDVAGFSYLARGGAILYGAIERIFITHTHGDHVGGLEEFALMEFLRRRRPSGNRESFETQSPRTELWGDSEVLERLWEHTLKGGLGVLAGRTTVLDDFFSVRALDLRSSARPDRYSLLDRYEIVPFRTDHVRLQEKYDWPSFGLVLKDTRSGRSAFYSGDTRFDREGLEVLMQSASILFHEVQLDDEPQPVHTLLSELRTLPEDLRRRMYLYHYADHWDDPKWSGVTLDFAGFAEPRKRYVLCF